MPNYFDYLELIDGLRENDSLCNATLASKDGASFKVHSAVLMASSAFFKAAFEFGPGEGRKGVERPLVRLPNVSGDILNVILRYAYLKKIDLTCSTVWKIFLAADFLQIKELSEECCSYMNTNLSLPQCTKIFEMTQTNVFLPDVHDMATRFTLHNLCKPCFKLRNQQRAALELLKPDTLRALLINNVLNASKEQFVWDALIEWLEFSPEQRTQYLDQVLDTIRIGLLPNRFIAENVLGYPAVQSRPDLVKQVKDLNLAVDQLLSSETLDGVEIPLAVQPRLPHTVVLSIGGWVNGAPSLEIQLYDLNADVWRKVDALESSNPDHTMAYHGLARLDDDLYVIGGTENGTDTTRCLKLSLKTFKWEVLPSLTQSRDFVSVVALNGRIYAIGGRSNPHHARNNSAEFYDPPTNKWHPIAPMHHSRSDAGCTVYAGKIYVMGGFTGESVLSSSEVYDPVLNTWQLLPEMVTPRSGVRCVTLRKHIFAIGGFSGSVRLASMERLDIERGIWIPMEPMQVPRSNLGACVVGDEILAVGGYNGRSVDAAVEVYNVFEDKWYGLKDLPTPRSALNVVSIENGVDLAERLIGLDRSLPSMVRRNREDHRPEYGTRMTPNAELPAGQPSLTSFEADEDDSEWHDVIDPFGLSLVLPATEENAGFWSRMRLFGNDDDDSGEDLDESNLESDEMEWDEEEEEIEEEDDQGDVDME